MTIPYPDETLHWTDHFITYGFAVRRGLVDRAFCDEAVARVAELHNTDNQPETPPETPPETWTTENVGVHHTPFREGERDPVFDQLFDLPAVRGSIDELLGPCRWDEARNMYLMLRPWQPNAEAKVTPGNKHHIDFGGGQSIPTLYRGAAFQVILRKTEPCGGNLTVLPGTHLRMQRHLMQHPDLTLKSGMWPFDDCPEPFEFVAEPGDVLFMHHLLFHAGNVCAGATRQPRIALMCDAWTGWQKSIDPADPDLSPWQRSLAQNGAWTPPRDEQQLREDFEAARAS